MTTYRVGLTQRVWEETTAYVEANSPEEAEEKARDQAMRGELEWQFMMSNDEIELLSCEPAPAGSTL